MQELKVLKFSQKTHKKKGKVAVREIDLIEDFLKVLGPECTVAIRRICFQLVIIKLEAEGKNQLANKLKRQLSRLL